MFHHLVFGNRESLATLVEIGACSPYPPARELAKLCAEDAAPASWWDERAIGELRAEALRTRPAVFEPRMLASTAKLRGRREGLRARLREDLEARPTSAARMLASSVLAGASLGDIDAKVVRDAGLSDPDENLAEVLLAKRGNAPGLGLLFERVAREADASWRSAAALQLELLESGEGGEGELSVSLLLFAASSSWTEQLSRSARALGGEPSSWGRWPRLALAAVALRLQDTESLAFLRAESLRFFAALSTTHTETASLATEGLLRARDTVAIAQLSDACASARPHAGTARALLRLAGSDGAFAAPLEAFVAQGFGRMADGEPVAYAVQFARAAPVHVSFELSRSGTVQMLDDAGKPRGESRYEPLIPKQDSGVGVEFVMGAKTSGGMAICYIDNVILRALF